MSDINEKKEVHTTYASFWQRLLAHNIDLLFLLGFFYLYSLLPIILYDSLVFFLIYLVYHCAFELTPWRATPGKRLLKLNVTLVKNQRNKLVAIVLRNTLKVLSLGIVFIGFAMINFNLKKQSLHDLIAGTVVLFEEEIP